MLPEVEDARKGQTVRMTPLATGDVLPLIVTTAMGYSFAGCAQRMCPGRCFNPVLPQTVQVLSPPGLTLAFRLARRGFGGGWIVSVCAWGGAGPSSGNRRPNCCRRSGDIRRQ